MHLDREAPRVYVEPPELHRELAPEEQELARVHTHPPVARSKHLAVAERLGVLAMAGSVAQMELSRAEPHLRND